MKKHQKPCTKKVVDRGKRNKSQNGVKPVGNMNKNAQSFPEVSPA